MVIEMNPKYEIKQKVKQEKAQARITFALYTGA